jgi:ATP-binding cassette, subfamily B, heavy metal transporter
MKQRHQGEEEDLFVAAASGWLVLACVWACSLQLLRTSIDWIRVASQSNAQHYREDHHSSAPAASKHPPHPHTSTGGKEKERQPNGTNSNYGSTETTTTTTSKGPHASATDEEKTPLVSSSVGSISSQSHHAAPAVHRTASLWTFWFQIILLCIFLYVAFFGAATSAAMPRCVVWTTILIVTLSAMLTYIDLTRQRFTVLARILYLLTTVSLWIPVASLYYQNFRSTQITDEFLYHGVGLFLLGSIIECYFLPLPELPPEQQTENKSQQKRLSKTAIFTLLKPYVWPDKTLDSDATSNRIRAMATWVFVISSKICNIFAPMILGWASTALAHENYGECIKYSIIYAMIGFFGAAFKEGQSLVYLKVAQAAFVQLAETTFAHIHSLSLDWHLQKKLGQVIRSMDRGIAACDTLMKYLFLWLVPALFECVVVCVIFATYFSYLPLAISVFYFVWAYVVWTILVTLWRKKFRKQVVHSDNDWHDKVTDSFLNFETVKYFTAETFEQQKFSESIQNYQQGSVVVQASLSFLNQSQKLILQICLATTLSLSVRGIQERIQCCKDTGCDSGVSQCCLELAAECPGMQVGDFVAVLTYTLQLFAPLNFLGSVYNAVVMAIIDLTNLSELLAEQPNVQDAPDAMKLPTENFEDPDIAVEFDNVRFHYPSQPSTKGLQGVSFQMKRGTTTAIVGPTGAGKTTISRLLFRFYDVLGGAVKINGVDVRMVTQQSLREAMGVVPQAASMFHDSIKANLRYGRRDATDEELRQAAQDAQLLEFIESLPEGWDTIVGDRGLKLSGGEKV